MSVFRDPYYLDVEKLQPFASHNGIEADATIAVTVRDTDGKRTGGGVQVQVPGAVDVNFDHSRSGDNETVQNQTYSTHPVSALNALIDKLAGGPDGGILQTIPEKPTRGMHLECESDWAVSSATEMGGILSSIFSAFLTDPTAMRSGEAPPALMAEVLGGGTSGAGPMVLESSSRDVHGRAIILLLDAGNLRPGTEMSDLEDELLVFGQVDKVVESGATYSLERFLVPKMNREFRRQIGLSDHVGQLAQKMGREWDESAIRVEGPAVVLRPIAMY